MPEKWHGGMGYLVRTQRYVQCDLLDLKELPKLEFEIPFKPV